MLPVNYGGHAAYQDTFVSRFLDLFPDPFAVPKQTWDVIVKFWYLDLSETDTIMQEFYSLLGKPATRFPSCLLRSYLLSIVLKVDSITEWCRLLKITPLYAILSGFTSDDTPGVGTFYDFFNRLWQSDKDTTSVRLNIKKQNRKKVKNVVIKLPATPTVLLQNSFHSCSASTCPITILFILFSGCIRNNSLIHPSVRD